MYRGTESQEKEDVFNTAPSRNSQAYIAKKYIPCYRKLSCQAWTLDTLPLSNYNFPPIPSGVVVPTPLEAAGERSTL